MQVTSNLMLIIQRCDWRAGAEHKEDGEKKEKRRRGGQREGSYRSWKLHMLSVNANSGLNEDINSVLAPYANYYRYVWPLSCNIMEWLKNTTAGKKQTVFRSLSAPSVKHRSKDKTLKSHD